MAGSAGKALPGAIANLTFQGQPEAGIGRYQETVDPVLAVGTSVPVADLTDKLRWTHNVLEEHVETLDPGGVADLRRLIELIDEITDRLGAVYLRLSYLTLDPDARRLRVCQEFIDPAQYASSDYCSKACKQGAYRECVKHRTG